ncbi:endonuclease/exonuclease/phosphatase family protein [Paenibacillus filicis]|uniref:Endonuclease/exonuclease/phosphatase family protein n=1 Tax=Paenibacillus gyeongsangnamensis TaxID=3388067 RepID=A0ABT4QBQ2_9BACL|nr:endonuclease/exonuclease/phosphatase family protein [Paenibacillus filicis]MCZ8514259.1 endonuclease/exonuclease/phosphatase family protein [Paenibacillus filicis]
MQIKVITFNIHHGKGIDGKLNLNRIAEAVEESEADFIALNEVDRFFSKRSDYADQVSWLAERLKMNSAFGAAISLKPKNSDAKREYGNALLSRYPIVSVKNHLMDSGIIEGRVLLETDVLMKEISLRMYVTHLSLNPLSRKKQIDFIADKITEDRPPVIIAGNWNMKPGGKAWRKISGILKDCYATASTPCHTFPSLRPVMKIDYIFTSRNIHVASVEVIKKIPAASDHLPLIATLILN